jgi:hypothetical protein
MWGLAVHHKIKRLAAAGLAARLHEFLQHGEQGRQIKLNLASAHQKDDAVR